MVCKAFLVLLDPLETRDPVEEMAVQANLESPDQEDPLAWMELLVCKVCRVLLEPEGSRERKESEDLEEKEEHQDLRDPLEKALATMPRL